MFDFLSNLDLTKRINDFESNASIYVPNKFDVWFYGEYVDKAIEEMERVLDNYDNPSLGSIKRQQYDAWKSNFYDVNTKTVTLKWTAKNISIPTPKAKTATDLTIDARKGIKHVLNKELVSDYVIKLEVVETRTLMMYQFFNALMNQFFDTATLRSNSSFQKLNIGITTYQGEYDSVGISGNEPKPNAQVAIANQMFEFNSVAFEDMSDISLSNESGSNIMVHTLNFKAPNPFQGEFNDGLAGLRDNTSSDRTMVNGTYNIKEFESNFRI